MCAFSRFLAGGVAVLALSLSPFSQSAGGDLPEMVEIGSLARLYDVVIFDHALHLDVADSCATCHHHTTGTPAEEGNCVRCHTDSEGAQVVACRSCHLTEPFTAASIAERERSDQWFHVDKPGLKGAFHQNCLGCHAEMDAPTGCQDCHARNELGDAFFNARISDGGKRATGSQHR